MIGERARDHRWRNFVQVNLGIADAAADIGLHAAPVAKAEQHVAHAGQRARATVHAIGLNIGGVLIILALQHRTIIEPLALEAEMAEIIANRAADFPAGLELIRVIIARRTAEIGMRLRHRAAVDGDVGALVIGIGRSRQRARRKGRGDKKLSHSGFHPV